MQDWDIIVTFSLGFVEPTGVDVIIISSPVIYQHPVVVKRDGILVPVEVLVFDEIGLKRLVIEPSLIQSFQVLEFVR